MKIKREREREKKTDLKEKWGHEIEMKSNNARKRHQQMNEFFLMELHNQY